MLVVCFYFAGRRKLKIGEGVHATVTDICSVDKQEIIWVGGLKINQRRKDMACWWHRPSYSSDGINEETKNQSKDEEK